jgi:hypothetical protein
MRVQLYNVPDKHEYGWLPVRMWRKFWRLSVQLRLSVLFTGIGIGTLINLLVRIV